ncbi:S1-like domain-containing RNA-binding protein [Paenibacillus profundus]|uniref:S1-like domain-containing RNA-binding protein n=1 Tax=Paenibacillus profundus TaxID=1173085 RepID=A0ABS8YA10_9BACL|nr:S1-like domain-containing RNA-binding protein [Paenibacillus profundus]MCE5167727.1 S1-like domain-containing RNA-binding protein [Paenibacillus profundus]
MTLVAGMIQQLTVAREVSPYGYFLTDGELDVLLHYSEMTGPIKPGEQVDVFLFFDTEDRLASTMKRPYLTLGEVACLKVADIHPKYGCFLEMGIGRQLLLPRGEMPEYEPLHPQLGDDVYVKMAHDKFGRLVALPAREDDLIPLVFHAPEAWLNTWHEAIVYRALKMGTFFVIDGAPLGFGIIGLLHESQRPRPLRLGERVRVRITHVREDGRVNVTTAERKEVGMDKDADRLFRFLKERPNGTMPYSDETPADIVKQRFNMSKSAFKRSIGRLMKAGLIDQNGSWTELTQAGKNLAADELAGVLQQAQSEPRKPSR